MAAAGIMIFRRTKACIQVLLVLPGGPLYDEFSDWHIPKGKIEDGESVLNAAMRETSEETGFDFSGVDERRFISLGEIQYKNLKVWAFESDFNLKDFKCNTFKMEFPVGSGQIGEYPENCKIGWFTLDQAEQYIVTYQRPFVKRLSVILSDV